MYLIIFKMFIQSNKKFLTLKKELTSFYSNIDVLKAL